MYKDIIALEIWFDQQLKSIMCWANEADPLRFKSRPVWSNKATLLYWQMAGCRVPQTPSCYPKRFWLSLIANRCSFATVQQFISLNCIKCVPNVYRFYVLTFNAFDCEIGISRQNFSLTLWHWLQNIDDKYTLICPPIGNTLVSGLRISINNWLKVRSGMQSSAGALTIHRTDWLQIVSEERHNWLVFGFETTDRKPINSGYSTSKVYIKQLLINFPRIGPKLKLIAKYWSNKESETVFQCVYSSKLSEGLP